jgi:hypothetical protein
MGDQNEESNNLRDLDKVEIETPEPSFEIRKDPESQSSEAEWENAEIAEVFRTPGMPQTKGHRLHLRKVILVVPLVVLCFMAATDLIGHHFNDATVKSWLSLLTLIAAAFGAYRATRRGFKKSSDGTIFVIGEEPGQAAKPSLRTYLIMFAIFLIFLAIIGYVAYFPS